MLFEKQVILLDEEAADRQEAEAKLADRLYDEGLVTDAFKVAILKRESEFPTGLQTVTIGVAIPHTDADKVVSPQIGFMRLKQPVMFHQMGDNAEIQVKLIFMLALKHSDDQLKMLQTLMALFQNQEAIDKLEKITTKIDFLELMKEVNIDQ